MAVLTYMLNLWAHDRRIVADARERFRANPEAGLLDYAVALYSFRHRDECQKGLVALTDQLISAVLHWVALPRDSVEEKRLCVHVADILSTHLLWLSSQPAVINPRSAVAHRLARSLCLNGLTAADNLGNDMGEEHSGCLLRLTHAQMLGDEGHTNMARTVLNFVQIRAPSIANRDQRSRVYRKLGALYRRYGRSRDGWVWGIRACVVPGCSGLARLKSIIALSDRER